MTAWLVCMVAMFGSMAVMAVRDSAGMGFGGITQSIPDVTNNLEMEMLARFAVSEYNNNKVLLISFHVISAFLVVASSFVSSFPLL